MFKYFRLLSVLWTISVYSYEVPDLSRPEDVSNETILLSPMRSGTNLTLFSIQILTNRNIHWFYLKGPGTRLVHNKLGLPLDSEKKPIYRSHHTHILKSVPSQSNRLITILRNPKEMMLRNIVDDIVKFKHVLAKPGTYNTSVYEPFFEVLRCFDNWNPSNRLLIYYEDLLLHPQKELVRLLDFLGEDHSRLVPHLANIEADRQKMISIYQDIHKDFGGSASKGQDVLYHSKKVPLPLLRKADGVLMRKEPILWDRYLSRYKTP